MAASLSVRALTVRQRSNAPALAHCLLLDKDQLKADGFFKNGTLQKPDEFAGYCEQLANAAPGIGSFSGITLYVHELNMPPPATGASLYAVGTVFGVDAKTLNIYRVGLNAGKRTTIAHELSHVLGLAHAFPGRGRCPSDGV